MAWAALSSERAFAARMTQDSHRCCRQGGDFERFAFTLDFDVDPANGPRVTHLGHLKEWRNAIAHQKAGTSAGSVLTSYGSAAVKTPLRRIGRRSPMR